MVVANIGGESIKIEAEITPVGVGLVPVVAGEKPMFSKLWKQ